MQPICYFLKVKSTLEFSLKGFKLVFSRSFQMMVGRERKRRERDFAEQPILAWSFVSCSCNLLAGAQLGTCKKVLQMKKYSGSSIPQSYA